MILIHLIVAGIIIISMVLFTPNIIYKVISREDNQKGIWNTRTILMPIIFTFIAALIHYLIDMVIWLISKVADFKYSFFKDTDTGYEVFGVYFLVSLIIIVVVSRLYAGSLQKSK